VRRGGISCWWYLDVSMVRVSLMRRSIIDQGGG
jgi:hypothetical protein